MSAGQNPTPNPEILTPEMQAIAAALKPILMNVFKDFAEATARNVPPQVSAAVVENLKKEFGPMVIQFMESMGDQGANPAFWTTPVSVVAVTKFDPHLEDPQSEERAKLDTTPAQLLQNLHDAILRNHLYQIVADSEFEEEEEDEDDKPARKKKK